MKRSQKLPLYALAAAGLGAVGTVYLFHGWEGPIPDYYSREIATTSEHITGLKREGYPISINRAFQAGQEGGVTGDIADLKVYRYPLSQSDALIAFLKHKYSTYAWNETAASFGTFHGLDSHLPPDLRPAESSTFYVVGTSPHNRGDHTYFVDCSVGLFYDLLITN